jgi:hypothetical protein
MKNILKKFKSYDYKIKIYMINLLTEKEGFDMYDHLSEFDIDCLITDNANLLMEYNELRSNQTVNI